MSEIEEIFDMSKARAKFAAKVDTKKAARRGREKKLAGSVDRRTVKATDRTETFAFRCSADIKDLCKTVAKRNGLSIADWMETTLETFAFSSSAEIKDLCKAAAKRSGMSIPDWMEKTLRAAVEGEGDGNA